MRRGRVEKEDRARGGDPAKRDPMRSQKLLSQPELCVLLAFAPLRLVSERIPDQFANSFLVSVRSDDRTNGCGERLLAVVVQVYLVPVHRAVHAVKHFDNRYAPCMERVQYLLSARIVSALFDFRRFGVQYNDEGDARTVRFLYQTFPALVENGVAQWSVGSRGEEQFVQVCLQRQNWPMVGIGWIMAYDGLEGHAVERIVAAEDGDHEVGFEETMCIKKGGGIVRPPARR